MPFNFSLIQFYFFYKNEFQKDYESSIKKALLCFIFIVKIRSVYKISVKFLWKDERCLGRLSRRSAETHLWRKVNMPDRKDFFAED